MADTPSSPHRPASTETNPQQGQPPLPPKGVKNNQQHAHRAISTVHTWPQQRRPHLATDSTSLQPLQSPYLPPEVEEKKTTHNKLTYREVDPKKEKAVN
jgi:hypothetical protein